MEEDRWILPKLLQILICTVRSWYPDTPVFVKGSEWWKDRDSCLSSRTFQNWFMSTWHCSQLCSEHCESAFLNGNLICSFSLILFQCRDRMLIREEKGGEKKLAVPKPLWNLCSLWLALPCLHSSILFYDSILYVKSSLTSWTQYYLGRFSSLNLIMFRVLLGLHLFLPVDIFLTSFLRVLFILF